MAGGLQRAGRERRRRVNLDERAREQKDDGNSQYAARSRIHASASTPGVAAGPLGAIDLAEGLPPEAIRNVCLAQGMSNSRLAPSSPQILPIDAVRREVGPRLVADGGLGHLIGATSNSMQRMDLRVLMTPHVAGTRRHLAPSLRT